MRKTREVRRVDVEGERVDDIEKEKRAALYCNEL
jgi:hypothetical protein